MATEISSASIRGYRQVELNHMAAPRDGRVYAQLPADSSWETVEQGLFVKYDYANNKLSFDGDGPWFLVYNEEKLYDERKQSHCDYAMTKADSHGGEMYPRVFGLSAGDLYTTNNLADATYNVGDKVAPNASGVLDTTSATTAESEGTLVLKVVKETTMPDGQPAVKLQVIQA